MIGMPDLRANTIRWLASSCGELQKQVTRLEKENIRLRKEVQRLEARLIELINQRPKAMAAAAGK